MKTQLIDFNDCPLNDRNGTYGGNAGSKEGIVYDNDNWLIKYPKNTAGMRTDMSYTTSPLSEYLGSHIYQILGFDVHETLLGTKNGKIIVACKDFCEHPGMLREIRTLKNIYNKELEEILNVEMHSTNSSHMVNLQEILIHLERNHVLSKVDGIKERFWDCVVIDGFINNNDRNNGNWGVIYRDKKYELAPIYDNGGSFSNKLSDKTISKRLSNPAALREGALNGDTAYGLNNKKLKYKDILNLENHDLKQAIRRNVPIIIENMYRIREFINDIPETYNGLMVINEARKQFYVDGLETRLEVLLEPTLERIYIEAEDLTLDEMILSARLKEKKSQNLSVVQEKNIEDLEK